MIHLTEPAAIGQVLVDRLSGLVIVQNAPQPLFTPFVVDERCGVPWYVLC